MWSNCRLLYLRVSQATYKLNIFLGGHPAPPISQSGALQIADVYLSSNRIKDVGGLQADSLTHWVGVGVRMPMPGNILGRLSTSWHCNLEMAQPDLRGPGEHRTIRDGLHNLKDVVQLPTAVPTGLKQHTN